MSTALVRTAFGAYIVDLDRERLSERRMPSSRPRPFSRPPLALGGGATCGEIVAVLDRRPPLAVSHDAGRTWREAGGSLLNGVAVAIDADNSDRMLYLAVNRMYVSEDGGRFWRAIVKERRLWWQFLPPTVLTASLSSAFGPSAADEL